MPIIPYVWSGLSRETRRQIERDEASQGNTVAWIRLVINEGKPSLDLVNIQGYSATGALGLLTIDQDLVVDARVLPHWLAPWPVRHVFQCVESSRWPGTRHYQVNIRAAVGGQAPAPRQPTVNPAEVANRLKRLVEIDIRGISPQPVSAEDSQPSL